MAVVANGLVQLLNKTTINEKPEDPGEYKRSPMQ
ncbi:hypothetical protein CCACVL1_17528 [Corchorus capsularis]|uniref:Uncharacterized protein n=1 Tax=Corchorus capsularis TaxID=210143 RepID=A0A1R3HRH5_COCAP|nr:hypothetical protein CCACVL1_17528 [Corchorus capsularis]